jgi:DNA-binding SARP family transcriptional activator/streptogramin lyase
MLSATRNRAVNPRNRGVNWRVMALEFRLLGPLEIMVDGAPLQLVGERQRALLALLLLHKNRRVTTERALDELWFENPPPSAQASLRVAVSKLRGLLGDGHRESLETVSGGYRLQVDPFALDSHRFEALLKEARAEPDPGRATDLLDRALELWRGPPLADVPEAAFVQSEARRLDELLAEAREERAEAELELGRHEALVPELRRLLGENTLRERLRGQLMLALYRSGRQTEALDVYRQGRRELMDELGLEPGEHLRRLEQAILSQDPAIAGPARAERRAQTRRRLPSRGMIAAVGLVVAGAVAGLVFWLADRGSATPKVPSNSLAVVNAATNRLTRIPLGWPAAKLVLDRHTAWVANARDDTLSRFDLQTRRIERTTGLGVTPAALAAGEGAVWVLSEEGTLTRIDPAYGSTRTTRVPLNPREDISVGSPIGLAVGEGAVWIEDGNASLLRIDPATGVRRRLDLGRGIDGVAVGLGAVWVIKGSPANVLRVDPRTGSVTTIPIAERRGVLAPFPIGIAVGSGAVWVLNGNTGTVTRIDPETDAVAATIGRISVDPTSIASAAGQVWVADTADESVQRIDPADNRVTQVADVGGRPMALAAARGGIWVAVVSD